MCDKCDESDRQIAHYMLLLRSVTDRVALDRIAETVAEMRAESRDTHPSTVVVPGYRFCSRQPERAAIRTGIKAVAAMPLGP
jgi:hypothetical protein